MLLMECYKAPGYTAHTLRAYQTLAKQYDAI